MKTFFIGFYFLWKTVDIIIWLHIFFMDKYGSWLIECIINNKWAMRNQQSHISSNYKRFKRNPARPLASCNLFNHFMSKIISIIFFELICIFPAKRDNFKLFHLITIYYTKM